MTAAVGQGQVCRILGDRMGYSYSVEQWLFIFYLYSFLGWCFESTVVSLQQHPPKWINRGFMHGPFLPLYGSGAVMMLVVSAPFQENLLLTYVAGFLGATVLEYITGVTMESLFKIRYWDYSDKPLNFHGHICLGSSIAWGFLTIAMTKFLHKGIAMSLTFLPDQIMKYLVIGLTIYIAVDFSLSFKAALDLRDILVKLEKMKEEAAKLQERLDTVSENIGESAAQVRSAAGQKIGAVNEKIETGITSVGEKIGTKVDAAGEKVSSKIGSVTESFSAKIDSMTARMEELLLRIRDLKENVGGKPAGYLENARSEASEIRDRLLVVKSKLTDLLDVKDRFKRRMLLGNPSMRSEKFKGSLEELRAAVSVKSRRHKDNGAEETKTGTKEMGE